MSNNAKKIPKPKINKKSDSIPKPVFFEKEDGISFSFAALEWTEYFSLEGTCVNWSFDLFNMLHSISKINKLDLLSRKYKTYRVHSHEKATPPNDLPKGVELKDCYQLRISKSKGGIHGVFAGNVFYVIWLDPLHNMYPDPRYGGLRTITPPATCCREREEYLFELKEENQKLREDNEYWEKELSKI